MSITGILVLVVVVVALALWDARRITRHDPWHDLARRDRERRRRHLP